MAAQLLCKAAQSVAFGCRQRPWGNTSTVSRIGTDSAAPTPPPDDANSDELHAADHIREAFSRGQFRRKPVDDEEGRTDSNDDAVIQESWELLEKALRMGVQDRRAAVAAESPAAHPTGGERALETVPNGIKIGAAVDPEDFPFLLSRRVHEDVVRSLMGNLMEVEVRGRGYRADRATG